MTSEECLDRVAPSTYCVRSPHREDPADAKVILADAREKVQVLTSGFVDEVEAIDVEKDDDSEADTAEDLDVEDVDAKLALKSVEPSYEVKRSEEGLGFSELNEVANAEQSKDIGSNINGASSDQEDDEISDNDTDETSCCETWVQGLADGDYSILSVEECLNALVAVFGIAMEGNTVCFAVEERLEAANALRKQMLAEAHLDKRRLKEEHPSKSLGTDGKEQKPNTALENKAVKNDTSAGTDNPTGQQQSMNGAGGKSRAQMKLDIARKAGEVYMHRWLPLGMDRRCNRYWQFSVPASCADPGSGKIVIELHDGGWGLIDSEECGQRFTVFWLLEFEESWHIARSLVKHLLSEGLIGHNLLVFRTGVWSVAIQSSSDPAMSEITELRSRMIEVQPSMLDI